MSVSLKNGRISFRHPIARDEDGERLNVKHRLMKLQPNPLEQEQTRLDLEKLVAKMPRLRNEVDPNEGVSDIALDIYFRPMAKLDADTEILMRFAKLSKRHQAKGEQILRFLKAKGREKECGVPTELLEEFIDGIIDEQNEFATGLNSALETIKQKENIIEGLEKATGIQTAQQKAITLQDCFEHFATHVSCRSADAKQKLLYRVQHVIDAMGKTTKHYSVTKKMIEDGIRASKPNSDAETLYRGRDIRRFFRLLAWPKNSDGLALTNPADAFKTGSQATLQRKRRMSGQVEILDPHPLLQNEKLTPYWKALVAVLGYGGLRLAEAASLEWDRIDFKKQIIRVRPTAVYPELKSVMSARDVKPFPNIWTWLREYKKQSRHESIVFDRIGDAGPTWFRLNWIKMASGFSIPKLFTLAQKDLRLSFEGKEFIQLGSKKNGRLIKTAKVGGSSYRLAQTEKRVILQIGDPTASDLSGALIDAIGEAVGIPCKLKDGSSIDVRRLRLADGEYGFGLASGGTMKIKKSEVASLDRPREPARRLRRFWETSMRGNGLSHLIQPMGGHSDEVGLAHYTKFEKIVAESTIPELAK